MNKTGLKALLLGVAFALPALALPLLAAGQQAAAPDPAVGLWRTIDDESGKPKSLVRITQVNGEYSGRIERLFREPDQEQNPRCDKCEDSRHNQPILGMVMINGMKRDGERYSGGRILDPVSGKIYRATMTPADGGRKLEVRGYIGVPALGRSQTWVREQ
jgi:uncharacterized protein (DUF2147 family)